MLEAMGGICTICGFNNPKALVIHHINPEDKSLSFSTVRSDNVNWELIVKELRKCTLLCANCHNIVHADGIENYEFISSFNEEYCSIQTKFAGHLLPLESSRHCIVCGSKLNSEQLKCCSEKCRTINIRNTRQIVNWAVEKENILKLRYVDNLTYKAIGKIYNCSDRTISDRIKEWK